MTHRFSYTFDNPDCPWCETQSGDEITYLPLNTLPARLFSPADPDFLSDLIWMRTCYYFGAHSITDNQYDYLSFLLELITDLSPKWELPYTFGAISLFIEADSPFQAMGIIDKGLKHLPLVWELHFLSGYIAWKHFKDMESASISLLKASKIKGAPSYLASLSATLALKSDSQDFIDMFDRAALEIIDNSQQRQVIQNKIRKMETDDHD
ncbi:hypothetical protein JCM12294_25750 [Desulfocicer niacini]